MHDAQAGQQQPKQGGIRCLQAIDSTNACSEVYLGPSPEVMRHNAETITSDVWPWLQIFICKQAIVGLSETYIIHMMFISGL